MSQFFSASADFKTLSARAQVRLLQMTYERLLFGIRTIPFVGIPFVIWASINQSDNGGLWLWFGFYILVAIGVSIHQRRFKRDLELLDYPQHLRKWVPIVHSYAWIHGVILALVIPITAQQVSFEFAMLLHISIAAIMAANATHQTPFLSSFQRFFFTAWGQCMLYTPLAFPQHWQYILPLSLIYMVAIYKNALTAHHYFVQQAKLEEDSAHLAEQYRIAKEAAEAALIAKNQFLTTASHDLRQPVQAMGFLIESIARRNKDVSLEPSLNDLRSSIRSVHLMFNSLLDLSKIESGAVNVKKSPVIIDNMLRDVSALFSEEAHSRGLELRVHFSQEGIVMTDIALLRQCLLNLTHNALRYTLKGGMLLSARQRKSEWLFEVWDTGLGIANNDRDRIYSPLYRNELAWKIDDAGHGLGLAVVARCANLMGATYGFTSKLGKGSRFWLKIPLVTQQQTQLETEPLSQEEAPAALSLLSGNCLLVDDDPQIRNAFHHLMDSWQVTAKTAESAREAFDIINTGFNPQVILCDQRLRSGESGFELLKGLLEHCTEATGVMISGEYDSKELKEAENDGYMVLPKPLEVTHLHAILSSSFV